MKKLSLILILTLITIPFESNAEWISLKKNINNSNAYLIKATDANRKAPEFKILKQNENFAEMQVEISGFDISEQYIKAEKYKSIDLLTNSFAETNPGMPQLPSITKIIAIPDGAELEVEITETGDAYSFSDISILPVRESNVEGKPLKEYTLDAKVYNSDDYFPEKVVSVSPTMTFRDFKIARVSINPVRYNPLKNEVSVISSMKFKLNFLKTKSDKSLKTKTISIAPSFAQIYRHTIDNYESILATNYNINENGKDLMLCIMPDKYYNTFQEYAQWKKRSGIDIKITKFSEIGANSENHEIIKQHISDAYHNWETPPTYVLLIGDYGVCPLRYSVYPDYTLIDEDYFVRVEGDDHMPEMMIGRLPVQQTYTLEYLLQKMMDYERNPYLTETQWYKQGLCCSNNYHESQVTTKRFTAEMMKDYGGFTFVDTLMSDGEVDPENPYSHGKGCTMDLGDVIKSINNGKSYINYRGEAWTWGWGANCYEFTTDEVTSLNNGRKLPFVTNIGCGVAKFDEEKGNCFGEEWLKIGNAYNPRGACAFIGPTSNTHTTYNNRIDKGIYVGMFREKMETPGQALLRGKIYMTYVFGDDPYVDYHSEIYCILGDPSLHIWKNVPEEVNVTYQQNVSVGLNQPEIHVAFKSNGQPVDSAQVIISGDGIFESAFTDPEGNVSMSFLSEKEQILDFVVRGPQVKPFENVIYVKSAEKYLYPEDNPTTTDLSGNMDGIINPNEDCSIKIHLKNKGTQTANNVLAQLTIADDSFAEIQTSDWLDAGSIAPNASSSSLEYKFNIKDKCPVGYKIPFKLSVKSENDSWEYGVYPKVEGCSLVYIDARVEEIGTTMNDRMDPGETVKLFITVKNEGVDKAVRVVGLLRSEDSLITISDNWAEFGAMDIQEEKECVNNSFVIDIPEDYPPESRIVFFVKLEAREGQYEYFNEEEFELSVGMPNSSDPTGPDDYGYYAYSSHDDRFKESPEYEWKEIQYIGEEISSNTSNTKLTRTIDIPFDFKYYGKIYDKLRVSSDGWIAFGSGSGNTVTYMNTSLPKKDQVSSMAAVFWGNFIFSNHSGLTGKMFYHYDYENNQFIIEWKEVSQFSYNQETKKETFQVALLDPQYYSTPTGDGELLYQYKSMHRISSATVGIENHNDNDGMTYVFNGMYDKTASFIDNEMAIKFTTEAPQLVTGVEEETSISVNIPPVELGQNLPNPFDEITKIRFRVNQPSKIALKIYDILGQERTMITSGEYDVGEYEVPFNSTGFEPGLYFYSIETSSGSGKNTVIRKKMIINK